MSRLNSLLCASALTVLAAVSAHAQDQSPQPDRRARAEEFSKRFAEADTNGDGKLSREEAQAKMPQLYEHFDQLDSEKKGYLTKQDIAKAMRRMRGQKMDNAS